MVRVSVAAALIVLVAVVVAGLTAGIFVTTPITRTTVILTTTQFITKTEFLTVTTHPKPPDWVGRVIEQCVDSITPFAQERGIVISEDLWLSLEKELTLSFWNGVVTTENQGLRASLIWLGITVLEAKKRNISTIDSAVLYSTWFHIISTTIPGRPHNPFNSLKTSIINNEQRWLNTYPELRLLLKG
jgi:hypothetical protein